MKVSSALYKGDYSVHISFEDGTEGIINLSDLVEKGVFRSLKEKEKFSTVYTTGYSIAWSDELEIDAANIYAEISGKDPLTSFTPSPIYATD